MVKGPLEEIISLFVLVFQVTEVGKGLDPKVGILLIAVFLLICLAGGAVDARVLAPFKDLFGLVVVDVESEQLLPQVKTLAAIFNSLVVLINLKQEKHIVLVDLSIAIIFLQKISDSLLDFYFLFDHL